MIKSMTGYGCAGGQSGKLAVTAEVRSVNNRFLDCAVRLPRVYTALEDRIKSQVQAHISRGKTDVYITIDASQADDSAVTVNEPVADAYMSAISALAARYGISGAITASELSRMPDVLLVQKKETDVDALGADIGRILGAALDDFDSMRLREGAKLRDDILSRADTVERLVGVVEERSPKTVAEYRAKLRARMDEVLGSAGVDENRILAEAALYADRVAVDEETVRLRSHVSQLREMMDSGEPVGRKLDFLVQEFNREANTIGSKCSDLDLSGVVVDLKSEIEKIREQVQNIE